MRRTPADRPILPMFHLPRCRFRCRRFVDRRKTTPTPSNGVPSSPTQGARHECQSVPDPQRRLRGRLHLLRAGHRRRTGAADAFRRCRGLRGFPAGAQAEDHAYARDLRADRADGIGQPPGASLRGSEGVLGVAVGGQHRGCGAHLRRAVGGWAGHHAADADILGGALRHAGRQHAAAPARCTAAFTRRSAVV